ncbi:MAG: hypothetical protein ACOZBL_05185 [Patescibacteria group bacterium]
MISQTTVSSQATNDAIAFVLLKNDISAYNHQFFISQSFVLVQLSSLIAFKVQASTIQTIVGFSHCFTTTCPTL